MAYHLQFVYIVVTCVVLAQAMPSRNHENHRGTILQELRGGLEKFIEFRDNVFSPGDQCRDNDTSGQPSHASCRVEWTFGVDCEEVSARLVKQINLWEGPENCKDGGEKCLYEVTSLNRWLLRGKHTTPQRLYVDNFGFRFRDRDYGCYVKSYSYSTVPGAVGDFGTNFCNMFNLIDGSGLNKEPKFSETTCNKVCTQYTTADCEVF